MQKMGAGGKGERDRFAKTIRGHYYSYTICGKAWQVPFGGDGINVAAAFSYFNRICHKSPPIKKILLLP